jgi:thiosulfate dehydrogenase
LKAPALSALGKDAYGDMVRYGYALTTETYAHIGPNAKNQKMRYAGNNLSCQSCQEERATKPYAMPLGTTAASAVLSDAQAYDVAALC